MRVNKGFIAGRCVEMVCPMLCLAQTLKTYPGDHSKSDFLAFLSRQPNLTTASECLFSSGLVAEHCQVILEGQHGHRVAHNPGALAME